MEEVKQILYRLIAVARLGTGSIALEPWIEDIERIYRSKRDFSKVKIEVDSMRRMPDYPLSIEFNTKTKKYRWQIEEEIAQECYPTLSEHGHWMKFESNSFSLDGSWTLDDLKLIVKAAEEFQKRVNDLPRE